MKRQPPMLSNPAAPPRASARARRMGWVLILLCIQSTAPWGLSQPKADIQRNPSPDASRIRTEGAFVVSNVLNQVPANPILTRGSLSIRNGAGQTHRVPFVHEIKLNSTGWQSIYRVEGSNAATILISQAAGTANQYAFRKGEDSNSAPVQMSDPVQTTLPFAGSDFSVGDLGLEFLHWPDQRLLMSELRRGQSCRVIESTNPDPRPGAYSRVVSWIDIDSGGIVHADAYDDHHELLKQFDPREFKKVNGQWQLTEMEIRNRKTRSRTRIEFDVTPAK